MILINHPYLHTEMPFQHHEDEAKSLSAEQNLGKVFSEGVEKVG